MLSVSALSTPSTLTRIRSPWCDHACIHMCSPAMEFLNGPLSWLPSQLFGIKSLTVYGLGCSCKSCSDPLHGAGDAADCIQSAITCRVHFFTDSLQRDCKLLSDLLLQRHQVCCGGHACLLLCDCCCCRGSRERPIDSTGVGAYRSSATMSNGTLFYL